MKAFRLVFLMVLCVGLWFAGVPTVANAEGMLLEGTKGGYYPIKQASVRINIENQVSTTVVEQEYELKGPDSSIFYLFSTPRNASVVNFEVWKNGQWEQAEIQGKEQPKLPSSSKNSDLTKYLGANPLRVSVKTVGKVCKVRLTFVELLKYEKGKVLYTYPLPLMDKTRNSLDVPFELTLKLSRKIAKMESPSHPQISVKRTSEKEWTFKSILSKAEQQKPFTLYYQAVQDGLSMRFLAHRMPPTASQVAQDTKMFNDGYFLLMLEPKEDVSQEKIIAKTFTLVIDKSGSMSGNKIEQAKTAASRCIDGLHEKDYFNIVVFSSSVKRFKSSAVPATSQNRDKARDFIEDISSSGGTNISGGLSTALTSAPKGSDRPHLIIFLTDGYATSGETDPDSIVDEVKRNNDHNARIFAFGIGSYYNKTLLEELAYATKGQAFQLDPNKIDSVIQQFFQSINSPVLTDLTISFGNPKVNRVTPSPKRLPNVYLGNQLLILGRYSDFGKYDIKISGKVGSKDVKYSVKADFSKKWEFNSFLPRIWAMSYAKQLYREWVRGKQKDDTLKGQVKDLGLLYRIQTPFTSFGFSDPTASNDPAYQGGYIGANPARQVAGCSCSTQDPTENAPFAGFVLLFLGLLWLQRRR